MSRRPSRPAVLAAVLACALHVMVAGVLTRIEPRASRIPRPVETAEIEFDLGPEPARIEPAPAPEPAPVVASVGATETRSVRATNHGSQAAPGKAEPEGGAEIVAAEPPSAETWSFSGLRGPGTALSTLPTPALPDGPSTRETTPEPRARAGGISRALHEADVKHGFGRAGAVLSAAEHVLQAQTSLVEGKARFEASVDRHGQLRVTLLDASRERALWEGLVPVLTKRIDPTRLRLSRGVAWRGVAWRGVVEVEVRQQYRDGTQPKELGTKAMVSAGRLRPNPSIEDLPGITVMRRGKVCSVGINLGPAGLGLGGGCSPENIGAVAQRIVRGQIVEEEML